MENFSWEPTPRARTDKIVVLFQFSPTRIHYAYVYPESWVSDLYTVAARRANLPVSTVRISYKGVELTPTSAARVDSVGIVDGDTVQVEIV